MLVCGAQIARTLNAAGVKRTRKPALRREALIRGEFFGLGLERAQLERAALYARERVIRADTARFTRGFAPCGGAAQFKR